MLLTCYSHAVDGLFTCYLRAIRRLFTCYLHAVCMLLTRCLRAIRMLFARSSCWRRARSPSSSRRLPWRSSWPRARRSTSRAPAPARRSATSGEKASFFVRDAARKPFPVAEDGLEWPSKAPFKGLYDPIRRYTYVYAYFICIYGSSSC